MNNMLAHTKARMHIHTYARHIYVNLHYLYYRKTRPGSAVSIVPDIAIQGFLVRFLWESLVFPMVFDDTDAT